MPSERRDPTPVELRTLAREFEDLQHRMMDIHDQLQSTEETRHLSFRLDTAVGDVRGVRAALEETAGGLARTRIARDPRLCQVPWGVCPEHGNTLRSSGGRAWCIVCSREWGYDRLGTACREPVTHEVIDQTGATVLFCTGHARDAEKRLDGATVTPLPKGHEGGGRD